MPSCRPTHTHTHPPCHLAARHRSEPCPPAPASRCTATLHFRCPAAVLMRKPAPERKPELKPGPDPPYGNTPRNRRFRRAFPPAHNRRRTHSPTHSLAHIRPGTRIRSGTRIRPRNAHPRRPRRPALPLRPVDARAHKKAKHPCGCFASLWKRGVRYSPRAKRL